VASASRDAMVRGQSSQLKSFIARKSYFCTSCHSGESGINILQRYNSFLISVYDRSLAKGLKPVPPMPQWHQIAGNFDIAEAASRKKKCAM
jgi:hypothetical protein